MGPSSSRRGRPASPLRALAAEWHERATRPCRGCSLRHIARASLEALAELHALEHEGAPVGFVHGDLGPDHVLFGPVGDIRFVDFGAARFRGMDAEPRDGDRGTLPFVAPEIARGEARPTQAHDVYALAATLVHSRSGSSLRSGTRRRCSWRSASTGSSPAIVADAPRSSPRAERSALASALALDPAQARPRARRDLLRSVRKDGRQT